jgi:exonuclease VII large subunit
VRSVRELSVGDEIRLTLADGEADVTVTDISS